jgi:hypothetical protein
MHVLTCVECYLYNKSKQNMFNHNLRKQKMIPNQTGGSQDDTICWNPR